MNTIRHTGYGLNFPEVPDADLLERFERHNREVQEYLAWRDSLLIVDWEKGLGWAEICRFLEIDCPTRELPPENRGDYARGELTNL